MIIPKTVFRKLENQLHSAHRYYAEKSERLNEIRSDIYAGMSSGISEMPANGGSRESVVERKALCISELEGELSTAKAWLELVQKTASYFESEKENVLFKNFYGKGITVSRFAIEYHYDRQTIDNYRDKVVTIMMMMALEERILNFSECTK